MEAIGFALAVAGIGSLFQTCLHGYRAVNVAIASSEAALETQIRYRVEWHRLYLWGRNWNLVGDIESMLSGSIAKEPDAKQSGKTSTKGQVSLDDVDRLLAIPGFRNMILDILGQMQRSLEKWDKTIQRYEVNLPDRLVAKGDEQKSLSSVSETASLQKKMVKKHSSSAKVLSKIRWALKDKDELAELLTTLTALNDGLNNLLPPSEKKSLERALAGEILNDLPTPDGESDAHAAINTKTLGGEQNQAARMMNLRHQNDELREQSDKERKEGIGQKSMRKSRSPFGKIPAENKDAEQSSLFIPESRLKKLVPPRLEACHTGNFQGNGRAYFPLPRTVCLYNLEEDGGDPKTGINTTEIPVLIEWRLEAAESNLSELTPADWARRREQTAQLLHRTATAGEDFRVLNCLGFTKVVGYSSQGDSLPLIGYVYAMPSFAAPEEEPVLLRTMLDEAFKSDQPAVPDLNIRLSLAKSLAIALYQLQCAGWIHRKISSYNILFFRDKVTREPDLGRPFLGEWQYSRPDAAEDRVSAGRGISEGTWSLNSIGDLGIYTHPNRLERPKRYGFQPYRRHYDVYSLGVILVELAFWEPVISLLDPSTQTNMEQLEPYEGEQQGWTWRKTILEVVRREMGSEMGSLYREAALACLDQLQEKKDSGSSQPALGLGDNELQRGSRHSFMGETSARTRSLSPERRLSVSERIFIDPPPEVSSTGMHSDQREQAEGDPERPGLERDFYWQVVRVMERSQLM